MEPERIPVYDARMKVKSGEGFFVCAYEDDKSFNKYRIEGAFSFNEFQKIKPGLQKNREIILYCACEREKTSAGLAVQLIREGFTNVKVLLGGV